MILVAADPGLTGALAFYDTSSGQLEVVDMPTTVQDRAAKTPKTIIDATELWNIFSLFRDMGATHFVVEEVGGMPGQGASHSFNFGFGTGLLRMAAVAAGFAIEPVTPQRWKGAMRVSTTPAAIRERANQVIPTHAHLWAPVGRQRVTSEAGLGRAEAALLAAYGGRIFGAKK
jgi:crossover junction endodeoxyribonuclease RuvC